MVIDAAPTLAWAACHLFKIAPRISTMGLVDIVSAKERFVILSSNITHHSPLRAKIYKTYMDYYCKWSISIAAFRYPVNDDIAGGITIGGTLESLLIITVSVALPDLAISVMVSFWLMRTASKFPQWSTTASESMFESGHSLTPSQLVTFQDH